MSKRIAMLGGSFDPVHNGHLSLAENVQIELGYDKILFFPTSISPFKQDATPLANSERLTLLNYAVECNSHFAVDDFELRQQGVSYTIETIRYCYEQYHIDGKLGLIIGHDLLAHFYQWHEAETILQLVDLIVGQRPEKMVVKNGRKRVNSKSTSDARASNRIPPYIQLQNEALQISSTYIRTAIEQGKAWRYLVPEKVYNYIVEKRYYKHETKN